MLSFLWKSSVVKYFLMSLFHRLANVAHGEVECPFRCSMVLPVPMTRLHPRTENIRRVAIQAMLDTVGEGSLPQVFVQPGNIVKHHVVAPPLKRTAHVEDQPIRGRDALELENMSPLLPRITRALVLSTSASNVNGSTVNKSNTSLQRRSPPANGVRIHRRSLSH